MALPETLDRETCPIARALQLLGDRWSLLVIRELLIGGTARFSDFERNMPGASPSQISQKLKRLEGAGLIERHFYSQHPPRAEYVLTGRGQALAPVIRELYRFGDTVLAEGDGP